jgi:hypothetical protein
MIMAGFDPEFKRKPMSRRPEEREKENHQAAKVAS